MKRVSEFENFDRMARELLKVPHAKIKAKLEKEKAAKKRKKSKKSSASRVVIKLEGVALDQLLTPEGRRQSEMILRRNEDKLRKHVLPGGAQLRPRQKR